MRTTGLLPRHSKNGKTKNPHTFREQRRTQNFSRAFDCDCSYFVRSSSVTPMVLRRCKAAYPCAYRRNKAKKRFVLVQRFMPAYALCRHIIKLYKKTMRAGTSTCLVRMRIFSLAAKARNGALRAEWQCPTVCGVGQSVSACAKSFEHFQTFFARQQVISSCRRVSFYSSISLFMRIHVHNAAIR